MRFREREMTRNVRMGLRVGGVVLILAGVTLSAIGFIDFISSINSPHDDLPPGFGDVGESRFPALFLLTFIGLPLIAAGVKCLKAGFLGVTTRYVADESQEAVAQVSHAAATGWRAGSAGHAGFCAQCGTPQQQGARFCHQCGTPTVPRIPDGT